MRPRLEPGAVIGFIGLGSMGLPMARRLVAAGYHVRGYDVSASARAALAASAEALAVDSPARAAEGAAAVILMLPTSVIVDAVLHAGGTLDAIEPGGLVIDMGSSEPMSTRALAVEAASRGIALADAPVSGGVTGARSGDLTIMLGGDAAAAAACQPLLKTLGSRILHVGEVGAGHAVKALNNLLSATTLLATSEAVAIARSFGVDPELMIEAVNVSSGRSGSSEAKFPNFIFPETYASGFALGLMVKDVRIALGLGDTLGVPTSLGDETLRVWSRAADELPGAPDHTEIARWVDGKRSAAPVPAAP